MKHLPHVSRQHWVLAFYCSRWGGHLAHVEPKEFTRLRRKQAENDFSFAPFARGRHYNLGVIWDEKFILYSGEAEWPGIVHEMGHVFACDVHPGTGPWTHEYSFLGWEFALAQRIGPLSAWYEHNSDYGIDWQDDLYDFGALTNKERAEFLEERLEAARNLGLLSMSDVPLAIR